MSGKKKAVGPSIYILDSCAYFRLARSIRPLLNQKYGSPPYYKLFVLKRMRMELLSNPRLKSKFHWISDTNFQTEISAGTYNPIGKKKKAAENAKSFLNDHVKEVYLSVKKTGPSPADIEALAIAFAIPGVVVSDDKNLCETGELFGIETIDTVELLEKLLSDSVIDISTIQSLADYSAYDKDLPIGSREFNKRINKLLKK